ncbi:hypothetical protein SAMN05421637_1814 [Demequina mangrovi]|uniref:DUF2116 family Zn-ribbon domain-containing protein n=1 Tax=Demequina mangrovi TaxID=1043493 RepID=A0A1H6YV42_9MICO|nr:hypothetical protein SAMN05421637_1814 [Demequina mangrovi]
MTDSRTCALCRGPIPAALRADAVHCSAKCRYRATYIRRREWMEAGRAALAAS